MSAVGSTGRSTDRSKTANRGSARTKPPTGLDRVKPRLAPEIPLDDSGGGVAEAMAQIASQNREGDPLGRRSLFSVSPQRPWGTVSLECSSCHADTPVGLGKIIVSSLPISFHLVRRHLMRCPACGHFGWLRLHWRL